MPGALAALLLGCFSKGARRAQSSTDVCAGSCAGDGTVQQGTSSHSSPENRRQQEEEQQEEEHGSLAKEQTQQVKCGACGAICSAFPNGVKQAPKSLEAVSAREADHLTTIRSLEEAMALESEKRGGRTAHNVLYTTPTDLVRDVQDLRWLGQGAQGVVYEGVWQGATVAVKFSIVEKLDTMAYELLFSKMLSHPNVVQTFVSKVAVLDEETIRHESSCGSGMRMPPTMTGYLAHHVSSLQQQSSSHSLAATSVPACTPASGGGSGHIQSAGNLVLPGSGQTGAGSTPPGAAGSVLQRSGSFNSDDGFGDPLRRKATFADVREVLSAMGAKPGHFITQIVMEHCDHGSLLSASQRGIFKPTSKWGPKLALRALIRTAREVAQGMYHLHANNVIHGDLKPANVLLINSRKDRRGYVAKVSDFGLAQFCSCGHISNARWGTLVYTAPERLMHGKLCAASDVYSFGVILHEMYTGQRPYEGMHAGQIVMACAQGLQLLQWPTDAPEEIVAMSRACMAPQPAARPTFEQLMRQLGLQEHRVRIDGAAGLSANVSRAPSAGVSRVPSRQASRVSCDMPAGSGVVHPAGLRVSIEVHNSAQQQPHAAPTLLAPCSRRNSHEVQLQLQLQGRGRRSTELAAAPVQRRAASRKPSRACLEATSVQHIAGSAVPPAADAAAPHALRHSVSCGSPAPTTPCADESLGGGLAVLSDCAEASSPYSAQRSPRKVPASTAPAPAAEAAATADSGVAAERQAPAGPLADPASPFAVGANCVPVPSSMPIPCSSLGHMGAAEKVEAQAAGGCDGSQPSLTVLVTSRSNGKHLAMASPLAASVALSCSPISAACDSPVAAMNSPLLPRGVVVGCDVPQQMVAVSGGAGAAFAADAHLMCMSSRDLKAPQLQAFLQQQQQQQPGTALPMAWVASSAHPGVPGCAVVYRGSCGGGGRAVECSDGSSPADVGKQAAILQQQQQVPPAPPHAGSLNSRSQPLPFVARTQPRHHAAPIAMAPGAPAAMYGRSPSRSNWPLHCDCPTITEEVLATGNASMGSNRGSRESGRQSLDMAIAVV